ncbi:BAF_collapsed_G0038370.mRNA.1.CDS.1 [Saccharomyces cerevisiae]|nr:CFA_G0006380.mRNA.1.CDS.1 [Saccharomyces cerevisiae]CAI5269987.1 BAF_HP2_G0017400.mRNA.1.CDS.1 [Saccharomyces cerevisiae]CAI5292328.1 BAF_HP2_G0037420.mRNA.1.CDS.1 [Saccharomyces cerevisiae]CAI6506635.1 BAF_HP2_G0017400.mRNA.1.CDS.1 [Saccharomyces cerevisiae]CAI6604979.1 BAF_HP2_G0037420.mRNA.1.CDS.1 [Saccharomyces cerevisiae]
MILPVYQLTLHYPTSPLVTLSHSTIPLTTTIHLSTYYHSPTVHHNRYPPTTHIQPHYHLPYHYPTIHHVLLTILLFYPPY